MASSRDTGTGHWKAQRLSALALSILGIVFIIPFIRAMGRDWDAAIAIYKSPFNAVVAVLFFGIMFWHLHQGLEVIIDDYVPDRRHRALGHLGSLVFCGLLAVVGIVSVIIIAVGA